MKILFHMHSGIRYLVLLSAVVVVVYALFGLATKRTAGKPMRVLGAVYLGLLDLQVLLGLGMVLLGFWYRQLAGHVVPMTLAIGLSHAMFVINRKKPQPGFLLPLIGAGGTLLLIFGGLKAIGRGLLTTTLGS